MQYFDLKYFIFQKNYKLDFKNRYLTIKPAHTNVVPT